MLNADKVVSTIEGWNEKAKNKEKIPSAHAGRESPGGRRKKHAL